MDFRPVELMLGRVERNGHDSDSVLFTEYLYAGELFCKLSVLATIAAIQEDRERYKYNLIHQIVRADGVGEWSRVLDDALTGPASQHFLPGFLEVRRSLTERQPKGTWAHESTRLLLEILADIKGEAAAIPDKIAFKTWFSTFAELRNKTRGHGATTPAAAARHAPKIQRAINLVRDNNPIFKLDWAYLHRNLSGKYRVIPLGGNLQSFAHLKSAAALEEQNHRSGIYYFCDAPIHVDLVISDNDAQDFFVPNGGYAGVPPTYELLSLISDSRLKGDATPYTTPAGERPKSETEGRSALQPLNNIFTNAPANVGDYVKRLELEGEVITAVANDRHPIITLVGRGGIGKTSLALSVLAEISLSDRFDAAIWFSARDIDLMPTGAKPVQPRVLTEVDISKQYVSLISEFVSLEKPDIKNAVDTTASHLRSNPIGKVLYIFDNFETVRSPLDLFNWIDTNIRLPNKVIITSRFRDFKADYPVPIRGMEHSEAQELIKSSSIKLGISDLIGPAQASEVAEACNGHPYIMKIVLGEIANNNKYLKPAHLIARNDDILDALFERTFSSLSPAASRIFMTLGGWRSSVPRLAVEAMILKHGTELGDPEACIDQLLRMSLVESTFDEEEYEILEVPLSAALFSNRKLQVSPFKGLIEADIKFIQDLGAVSNNSKAGIRPQIETFFKRTAKKISEGVVEFSDAAPVLEFLSRGFPDGWLLLSSMAVESNTSEDTTKSVIYLQRYLELNPHGAHVSSAWERLIYHYKNSGDAIAALGAFNQLSTISPAPVDQVSEMANLLNNSIATKSSLELSDRKTLARPLISILERNISTLSATDMSRLAWLHLHGGDPKRAREVAEEGHKRDPENTHCRRISARLADHPQA